MTRRAGARVPQSHRSGGLGKKMGAGPGWDRHAALTRQRAMRALRPMSVSANSESK